MVVCQLQLLAAITARQRKISVRPKLSSLLLTTVYISVCSLFTVATIERADNKLDQDSTQYWRNNNQTDCSFDGDGCILYNQYVSSNGSQQAGYVTPNQHDSMQETNQIKWSHENITQNNITPSPEMTSNQQVLASSNLERLQQPTPSSSSSTGSHQNSDGSIYSSLLKILANLQEQIAQDDSLADRADHLTGRFFHKPITWSDVKFSKQASNRDDGFKPMRGVLSSSSTRFTRTTTRPSIGFVLAKESGLNERGDGASMTTINVASEPEALVSQPESGSVVNHLNMGTYFDDSAQSSTLISPPARSSMNQVGVSLKAAPNNSKDGGSIAAQLELAPSYKSTPSMTTTSSSSSSNVNNHSLANAYKAAGSTLPTGDMDEKTLISLSSESTISNYHETGGQIDYTPPLSKDSSLPRSESYIRPMSDTDEIVVQPLPARLQQVSKSASPLTRHRHKIISQPQPYDTLSGSTAREVRIADTKPRKHYPSGKYRVIKRAPTVKRYPADLVQLHQEREHEPASSAAQLVDDDLDLVEEVAPSSSPTYEPSDVSSQTYETRPLKLSHTNVYMRQIYPEQRQPVLGVANQQINELPRDQSINRPKQEYVLVPQQQMANQGQQQRTVYSLATAPGGLKGYLNGQSATQVGTVGAAFGGGGPTTGGTQSMGSSNNINSVLPLPSNGQTFATSSGPVQFQLDQAKAQTQRDLLNQPQTLQITAIPSIGYNGNGALVRLGPNGYVPVNGIVNGNGILNGGILTGNGIFGNSLNNLQDPLGRQLLMVNADRRELDWNFWIWPLLALVTLPMILSALFVPVFLKTIVILIQVLQSLGLLLPITNAIGQQMGGNIGSQTAANTNQIEESTTQT